MLSVWNVNEKRTRWIHPLPHCCYQSFGSFSISSWITLVIFSDFLWFLLKYWKKTLTLEFLELPDQHSMLCPLLWNVLMSEQQSGKFLYQGFSNLFSHSWCLFPNTTKHSCLWEHKHLCISALGEDWLMILIMSNYTPLFCNTLRLFYR